MVERRRHPIAADAAFRESPFDSASDGDEVGAYRVQALEIFDATLQGGDAVELPIVRSPAGLDEKPRQHICTSVHAAMSAGKHRLGGEVLRSDQEGPIAAQRLQLEIAAERIERSAAVFDPHDIRVRGAALGRVLRDRNLDAGRHVVQEDGQG